MPEMGGLEATAAIRELERITGAHLPIIAMTARAMTGDREACLAGGMDDYVSKPVHSKLLFEAMQRLTSPGAQTPAEIKPANTASAAEPDMLWDRQKALDHMDGDAGLLAEMSALFLEDYPQRLAALHQAVARRDTREVSAQAHALKGSVGTFGSALAFEAAFELEQSARNEDLARAGEALRKLEEALRQLRPVLSSLAGLSA